MDKRQVFYGDDGSYGNYSWWYTPTAEAIKWAVVAAIVVLFLLVFVGGYYHAQRRIKKGLPPLAYHRWLLPQHQQANVEQRNPQNQFSNCRLDGNGYGMHAYPPPAYNPDYAPPPTYQPPTDPRFTKVAPSQIHGGIPPPASEPSNVGQQSGIDYSPTAPIEAHSTGTTNPFR
ncbi:MAG: hypothetical protein M1827_004366 [Pycnora praestabilis]|nr:MAG: hypothetical protein M1827_004366 [Pycnora praestabilis]